MINVFKKRTRLCTLTTSVLFFLQGADVSMAWSWSKGWQSFTSFFTGGVVDSISSHSVEQNSGGEGVPGGVKPVSVCVVSKTLGAKGAKRAMRARRNLNTNPDTLAGGLGAQSGLGIPGVGGVLNAVPGAAVPGAAVPGADLSAVRAAISGAGARGGVGLGPANMNMGVGMNMSAGAPMPAGVWRDVVLHDDLNNDMSLYESIFCDENGKHRLVNGAIIAEKGEVPVDVKGKEGEKINFDFDSVFIGKVKDKDLADTLSGLKVGNIVNIISSSYSGREEQDNVSGNDGSNEVAVRVGGAGEGRAEVVLRNSNVQGSFVGLQAKKSGMIAMVGGEINDTYVGAVASQGGEIFLKDVDINASAVGLFSSDQSVISVSSGTLSVTRGGIGVISAMKGGVRLDGTTLTISEGKKSEKEEIDFWRSVVEAVGSESVVEAVVLESAVGAVGLLTSGGSVSFVNGKLEGSDIVALYVTDNLITDNFEENISEGEESSRANNNVIFSNSPNLVIEQSYIYSDDVSSEALSIIRENLKIGAPLDSSDAASAPFGAASGIISLAVSDIQNSVIKGEGDSYGIYFVGNEEGMGDPSNLQNPELKGKGNKILNVVLLKGSTLRVPEGVAIYSDNSSGYAVVKDDSTLSGGLLLNAVGGSNLSVFVEDSVIYGAAHVNGDSRANLYLSRGSDWYLTERADDSWDRLRPQCMDSCISSMRLVDSNVRFITSSKNENSERDRNSSKYRTLRIGSGKGTVYSAHNTAKIYFNANLMPSDVDGTQVSDRLLIHGNVDGKTTVYVQDTSGDTQQNQNIDHTPYSISIIQVFGSAKKDSFILNGGYVTREGLPYKYVLRAYGPSIPPHMQHFDKTLIVGSSSVWDFRLENQYVVPLVSGYTTANDFKIVVPPRTSTSSGSKRILVDSSTGTTDAGANVGGGDANLDAGSEDATPIAQSPTSGTSRTTESLSIPSSPISSTKEAEYTVEGYDVDSDGFETVIVPLGTLTAETSDIYSVDAIIPQYVAPTLPLTANSTLGTLAGTEASENLDGSDDNLGAASKDATLALALPASSSASGGASSADRGGSETPRIIEAPSLSETPEPRTPELGTSSTVGTPAVSQESNKSNISKAVEGSSSIRTSSPSSPTEDSESVLSNTGERSEGTTPIAQSSTSGISTPVTPAPGSSASGSAILGSSGTGVPAPRTPTLGSSSSTVVERPETARPDPSSADRGKAKAPTVVSIESVGGKSVSSQCNGTEQNGTNKLSAPYSCSDGKSYTIKNPTLKAGNKDQHSMHAKNENTIIKLEGATISGTYSSSDRDNVDLNKLRAVSAVLAEQGAEIVLEKKTTIQSSLIGLEAQRGGKVKMSDGTVTARHVGAFAGSGSSVELSNTKIDVEGDLAVAGLANNGGQITMDSGKISLTGGVAVRSESGGNVKLKDVEIVAKKQKEQSGVTEKFGRAAFLLSNNGSVDFVKGLVVTDANALWVRGVGGNLEKGSSRSKRSSDARPSMNRANIEFSTIRVEGDRAYGIYFDGAEQRVADGQKQVVNKEPVRETRSIKQSALPLQAKTPVGISGTVSLKDTDFEVLKSIAIYGNNSGGHVFLEKITNLSGDLLLKAENNSHISVSLDNSYITGGVRVDKGSSAKLHLSNESMWFLRRSVHNSLPTPDLNCIDSCVTSVNLDSSGIDFNPPKPEEKYQTLRIGEGKGTVYRASGIPLLLLNARLNPNDPEDQQVSDRLLIHGDVSGKTDVRVFASEGGNNVSDKVAHSVSIIQVYGKAEKDSFRLMGDYIALKNSPYKYVLRSYGPDVTSKPEHVQQKFMKDGGEFWNFRLENQYINSVASTSSEDNAVRPSSEVNAVRPSSEDNAVRPSSEDNAVRPSSEDNAVRPSSEDNAVRPSSEVNAVRPSSEDNAVRPSSEIGSVSHSGRVVRSVVPQVPTYLTLPNGVFHAGLMDISNQNKQLEILRATSNGMLEVRGNPALYLRGYGGSYRYASDLSALEYGYGGDVRYGGLEAGVLLQTIEHDDSTIFFGAMGTYGKLSLQPLDVEQSQKSVFDKWTATAYGSMQHSSGFYVDGILSYGLLKGDVLTLARGKTATLKGNPLSVSLTGGQSFATGYEGFVLDPQVQVIYQHLQFNKVRDIDGFDIEMGKLDQWVARVGGRLSKMLSTSDKDSAVSLYGKLHLTHGFGGKQMVHFKDAFQLGAFGSSLEAGLGFNAQLSQKFALHGDLVYQHKLTKAGFSGISFSGGLRYHF